MKHWHTNCLKMFEMSRCFVHHHHAFEPGLRSGCLCATQQLIFDFELRKQSPKTEDSKYALAAAVSMHWLVKVLDSMKFAPFCIFVYSKQGNNSNTESTQPIAEKQ